MIGFHRAVAAVCLTTILSAAIVACAAEVPGAEKPFRPPAVPLITHNPYLSIWSEADHLTDKSTTHWTRRDHSLVSLIRIWLFPISSTPWNSVSTVLIGRDSLPVPASTSTR